MGSVNPPNFWREVIQVGKRSIPNCPGGLHREYNSKTVGTDTVLAEIRAQLLLNSHLLLCVAHTDPRIIPGYQLSRNWFQNDANGVEGAVIWI